MFFLGSVGLNLVCRDLVPIVRSQGTIPKLYNRWERKCRAEMGQAVCCPGPSAERLRRKWSSNRQLSVCRGQAAEEEPGRRNGMLWKPGNSSKSERVLLSK